MKQAILLIEDSQQDARSIKLSFKRAGLSHSVFVVTDAESAADYLSGTGNFADRKKHPLPSVLLLSLHLPDCGAMQFLHWLPQQTHLKNILLIVLVQPSQLKEVVRAYDLGADSFLVKPVNENDLKNLIRSFPDALGSQR